MTDAWPVRPLRALAEVTLGRQRSPDRAQGPNMVPYLRAANVKDGVLDLSDVKEMDFNPSEQQTFRLARGDVLVTEGAGSLGAVGASAVWSGELLGRVCFQNTLLRLRPRPGNDPRYLMWWARHAYGSGLFASIADGANIYHLSANRVRVLRAPFPAAREQRAIAEYLDAETARIDSLIAGRQQSARALREWEQRRLLDLVGDWRNVQTASLRQFGTVVLTGPFGTQLAADEYADGGVPVINPTHIADGRITPDPRVAVPEEVAQRLVRHRLSTGDLVMGRKGDVGRAAVVSVAEDGWICGSDSMAIRTRSRALVPEYLGLALGVDLYRQQLDAKSTGAMVASVNESTLLEFRVPAITVLDQHSRVLDAERVIALGRAFASHFGRQINLLFERRQTLVTAAVTRQLDIPGHLA